MRSVVDAVVEVTLSQTVVQVCYPHERHGLAGKTSNSEKVNVMEGFLPFVDAVSQPNGQSEKSHWPRVFFLFHSSDDQKMCTTNQWLANLINHTKKW